MTAAARAPSPRRIIISLGATYDNAPAFDAAEKLGAALRADLHGLFVEEQALVDLSNLPIAHVVMSQAGSPGPLTAETMQAVFERGAHACRRALSLRARNARLDWSFDIARGEALQAVSTCVSGDDLIVIQPSAFGHTAGDLLEMARSMSHKAGFVCVISETSRSHLGAPDHLGPIVVIDDGDELGQKAVDLAARIARSTDVPVTLFIVAADQSAADRIEERDLILLGDVGRVSVHRFQSGSVDQIVAGLRDANPRFVIADIEGEPFGGTTQARSLFRASGAPIVLLSKQ